MHKHECGMRVTGHVISVPRFIVRMRSFERPTWEMGLWHMDNEMQMCCVANYRNEEIAKQEHFSDLIHAIHPT